jgi:hypothetical protein
LDAREWAASDGALAKPIAATAPTNDALAMRTSKTLLT